MAVTELMQLALKVKLDKRGKKFALCSIINAKSGKCSEDCHFCTQSAHFQTNTPTYSFKSKAEIIQAAHNAKKIGASHFSLVSSGRGLSRQDLPKVIEIIAAIKNQVAINVCASLGIIDKNVFKELKSAGLSRYHHNLETSKEFFPQVVTTHTFQERLTTIKAAIAAGLEVCAGGIFGLGESEEDRISMAISLRQCKVHSIPINILIPLADTPLADLAPLSIMEIIRSIALYRLIHQEITIRLAAGRESALKDFASLAFMAGADGMMIGGYLTQRGRSSEQDNHFVNEIKKLWLIQPVG